MKAFLKEAMQQIPKQILLLSSTELSQTHVLKPSIKYRQTKLMNCFKKLLNQNTNWIPILWKFKASISPKSM